MDSTSTIRLLLILTVNLAGTLVIYSLMAFSLARLHWRSGGVFPILLTIIAANTFWIIPSVGFRLTSSSSIGQSGYSLCFGNWLASAFAVLLLCQTARRIPSQLEDSARLDGCNWFGIYWHAVLPLVRPDLGFVGVLIVMATVLPFCATFATGEGWPNPLVPSFAILRLPSPDCLGCILAVSALFSLPVIGIFFAAKRQLGYESDA